MINNNGSPEISPNAEEQRLQEAYGKEIESYQWTNNDESSQVQQIHIRAKSSDGRGEVAIKGGGGTVENREMSFLDEEGERFGFSEGGWARYPNGTTVVRVRSTYSNQDRVRQDKIGMHNQHKDEHRVYPGAVAGAIAHLSPFYSRWSSSGQLTDDTDGDTHSSVHMYSHTIPKHYGHLVNVKQRPEDHGYDVTPKNPRVRPA